MVTALPEAIDQKMELALETRLSKKPALEGNDATALTVNQQQALDQHKVRRGMLYACSWHEQCIVVPSTITLQVLQVATLGP
jgi:hypothetical protein